MNQFAVALACFVLLHIGLSATGLRGAVVGRIGLGRYRIGFSIASLALLVWMIAAYGTMRADATDPLNQPRSGRKPGFGAIVVRAVSLPVSRDNPLEET